MQNQQQMQKDINDLRKMTLFNPKVKEVVSYIMSIPGYNRMPLNNLNSLFKSEINKKFPPYYQYDEYYNQVINEIINLIHRSNTFNLPPNIINNFNPNNNNN